MTWRRGRAAWIAGVVLAAAAGCGPVDTDTGDPDASSGVPRFEAPYVLDLGTVFVDEEATASLTLANRGDAELVITSLRLDRPERDLVVPPGLWVELPEVPLTLAPDETRVLEVSFRRTHAGQERAILYVESNDPRVPARDVLLRGTAEARPVEPPPPVCEPWADPSSMAFGSIPAGQTGSGEVGVSNRGGAECRLGPPTLSGDPAFGLEGDAEPIVLAPGTAHTWTVYFAPAASQAGEVTGGITWDVADADPLVVELAGVVGTQPGPQLIPDDYDFGVESCATPAREFCLYNTTTATLHLVDVALEQTGLGTCSEVGVCDFELVEVPDAVGSEAGHAIESGTKACVSARFAPREEGDFEGRLVLSLSGWPAQVATIAGTGRHSEHVDTFLVDTLPGDPADWRLVSHAVPESIAVFVTEDGVRRDAVEGWVYVPEENSLRIDRDAFAPGARLEVRYEVACF